MGFDGMNALVSVIKEKQETDDDSVIGVSGIEGAGKSTLSIQILRRVLGDECDSDRIFNVERNIAYTRDEVDKKLRTLPQMSGLIIDEGGRSLYRRDWMKAGNVALIKLFQQLRFMNQAIFINIPPFFSLDKDIRDKRIWLWLHVTTRGEAMLFLRDKNVFEEDPWHLKQNQKIIKRSYKGPKDGEEALQLGYMKTINYVDSFAFPKLPEDIEDQYTKISHERKLLADEIIPSKRETVLEKRLAATISELEGPCDYDQLKVADVLGLSSQSVGEFMKKMMMVEIRESR